MISPPADDDVPAALAPFDVLDIKHFGQASRFLRRSTGARYARIEPEIGAVELIWSEDERHRLWPGAPADSPDAFREALHAVWNWMISDLQTLVCCGEILVVARIGSPLAQEMTIVPPSVWNMFQMEDWELGIAHCSQSGDRLYDVHFRRNGHLSSLPDWEDGSSTSEILGSELKPYHTGLAGRPSSAHLCVAEHARRIARMEAEHSLKVECEALAVWLSKKHPKAPRVTGKTLSNNPTIMSAQRRYRASTSSNPEIN